MEVLRVENLTKSFGGITAVKDVSFSVGNQEILGLIGPNGAGKTTIFNLLSGVYLPDKGKIFFNNKNTVGRKPYSIVRYGMVRTFQNIRLFSNMTAIENTLIGRSANIKTGLFDTVFRTKKFKKTEEKLLNEVIEVLKFIGLYERGNMLAKNLSYGGQRRLELARALATRPKLILLDEPTVGMNAKESNEIMKLILKIIQTGVSAIVIEHDMKVIYKYTRRVVVMDYGEKICEGAMAEVSKDKRVIEAYLGLSDEEKDGSGNNIF